MEGFTSINDLMNIFKTKVLHASYRVRGRRNNFKRIYERGGFSGCKWPQSGSGSSMQQTKIIGQWIPEILKELNAKSLLDAACGDFTWMREIDLGDILYAGVDIVDGLIKKNDMNYSRENRIFIVRDIVKDNLPRTDAVLCRDCFVHLSNRDILKTISNFKRSSFEYLLTTTFTRVEKNRNLVSGRGWRPINLQRPPFNFPPPLKIINENCTEDTGTYSDKSLALWKVSLLPN